ncbi:MAG: hypothetical protein Q7T97_05880 [Burkholderiaceae bacterium]|nr:hypothetical protein [Burkholderiaceae bacterium]
MSQAQRIGPACQRLVEHLLNDRIVERLRAAQGVIHMVKPYGECVTQTTRDIVNGTRSASRRQKMQRAPIGSACQRSSPTGS